MRAAARRATCRWCALTQGEIERDRTALPADRRHPAAGAAAGGPAVPCALRRAGARRLHHPAGSQPRGRARRRRPGAGGARLIQRHANLRAGFRHAGLGRPVQVIVPDAAPRWTRIDLSMLDEADARAAARRYPHAGARRALRPRHAAAAPLCADPARRRRAPAHPHRPSHPDGRLVAAGAGARTAHALRRRPAIQQHGSDAAVAAARHPLPRLSGLDRPRRTAPPRRRPGGEALAGLQEPTYLAPRERTRAPAVPEQVALTLSEELTAALTRQARTQGLTLNSIIQAAWAILLGRLTGRDDVVFGVTVAGRPPEIAGIETMVGLFINTLPLRLAAAARQAVRRPAPRPAGAPVAADGASASGAGRDPGAGRPGCELFDTLTVFENYPVDEAPARAAEAAGLRAHRHRRPRRHALSAEPAGGAGRAAAAAARLSRRPVRRASRRRRSRERLDRLLDRRGRDARPRHRHPRHSVGRRAPHHPHRLERHRARHPGRHHPAAVRRAGRPHPGRHRARLRGPRR